MVHFSHVFSLGVGDVNIYFVVENRDLVLVVCGPPKLVPPPKFKMTPEKWWERKTTSYWVSVTFQGLC